MSKAVMQQALDALEPVSAYGRPGSRDVEQAAAQRAIEALRAAIAQPASQRLPVELQKTPHAWCNTSVAQPKSGPVAYIHWCWKKPELKVLSFDKEPSAYAKAHGFVSAALAYAAPVPAYAPLTNGEIYTAYIEATNQTLRPQDERLAMAFARAIEKAVRERS